MTENKIITFLTPEQEALIPVYREWRKIALSTQRIDREKAADAIKAAYALCYVNEPEIVFYDSPYAAAKTIIYHHLGNPLSKQLKSQRLQPVKQVRNQLDLQIYQQLDEQLFNQLYRQLLREKLELTRQLQSQLRKNLIRQLTSKIDNCIKLEEWVCASSLLDFCIAVLSCATNRTNWEVFQLIVKHCGWIYPFKMTCAVCERYIRFSFYKPTRQHDRRKPAIECADGYSMYPNYSRATSETID